MSKEPNEPGIVPSDLPKSEVFNKKEVYQHPQPADQGLPLKPVDPKADSPVLSNKKEDRKTSKEEGLNEANSDGTAGAFEGFEDQQS